MRILIHAEFLSGQYITGSGFFMHELILEVAKRHSSHTFIYLTRKPFHSSSLPGNVTVQFSRGKLVKWLGGYWWRRFRLPFEIKRLQANLVVAVDDVQVRSGGVPCCIFVLNRQRAPAKNKLPPFKKAGRRLLHAPGMLATVSEFDRQNILRDYAVMPEQLALLHMQAYGNTKALTYADKEKARQRFSEGVEYFCFAGDLHERHGLLELLKAFSQFKKWQQSGMKLLIAGNSSGWTKQLLQQTATFKYRSDVHIYPDLSTDDLHAMIGAAYAFVYPALTDHFPLHVLYAMRAEIPVITSETMVIKELAGSRVLYAAGGIAEGFAENMRRLYKDELLRADIIASAKEHLEQQGTNDLVDDCWAIMMRALQ